MDQNGGMNFEKMTLENGALLYILSMPHSKTVGLGVHVNVGTREEVWPEEAGLSHAQEHMIFQATKKFADSKAISEHVESVGGGLNAFTDLEATCFFNYLPSEEKIRGFEVLSQQVCEPLFLAKKIGPEIENVIHEIHRRNDDPYALLENKFLGILCGEHPLGKETLGIEESLRALRRKDFQNWLKRFYHPANFTFVAAGDIEPEEAKLYFEEYFPEKSSQLANVRKPESIVTVYTDTVIKKEVDQAHIMLGAATSGLGQRDSSVLRRFVSMIDGGMSSPLFQEVRDKRGLCYAIMADFTPYSDLGIFDIYIGTSPEKIEEAVDCITMVIQENKTSQELLEKSKESSRGKLAFAFETSRSILRSALMAVAYRGRPVGYEERLEEIQSVTIKEVEAVVDRYLKPEQMLRVALVPK